MIINRRIKGRAENYVAEPPRGAGGENPISW